MSVKAMTKEDKLKLVELLTLYEEVCDPDEFTLKAMISNLKAEVYSDIDSNYKD